MKHTNIEESKMKGKELIAQKYATNQKIVERFMADGTRFIKHIPFRPAIFTKIKEQFSKKNIKVSLGSNKWIKIERTGENPELKAIAKQVYDKQAITPDEICKIESEMLSKLGFTVQVKDIEDCTLDEDSNEEKQNEKST